MKCYGVLLLLLMSLANPFLAGPLLADIQRADDKFIAQIELHTVEELESVLTRAEALSVQGSGYSQSSPIQLVLHGEEVRVFLRDNYLQHKPLVDLAARLDAFNVIDIKVCEFWMGQNDLEKNQLPPFIDTVPFAPAEKLRLKVNGYVNF